MSDGAIAGAVIGSLIAMCFILCGLWKFCAKPTMAVSPKGVELA